MSQLAPYARGHSVKVFDVYKCFIMPYKYNALMPYINKANKIFIKSIDWGAVHTTQSKHKGLIE